MRDTVLQNSLSKPIESIAVDRSDLRKLMEFLSKKARELAVLEYQHWCRVTPQQNLQLVKDNIKKCLPLKFSIDGFDGEKLFGSVKEVFESSSFPEKVKAVYINSKLPYDVLFKHIPQNSFELLLDFSKPKVFDFSFSPTARSPNNSYFKVEGYDTTWVNGVFAEVDKKFKGKSSRIRLINKSSTYDIALWIFGLPLALSVCAKSSNLVHRIFIAVPALQTAGFIYLFLLCLIFFRIIFHYARWIFPMVEYKDATNGHIKHRVFLAALFGGILVNAVYDLIKILLG